LPVDLRAGRAAYDFAAAASRDGGVSQAPTAAEGSAHFSAPVDSRGAIDRNGVRPIAAGVAEVQTADAATGEQPAPTAQGQPMSVRSLPGRIWRALRRLQPMFPPMSCC